jgi:hypothetical protein
MTENNNWKYAQILVEYSRDDTRYLIAEVYSLNSNGEYDSFCSANLETVTDLKYAISDIERDGPNTWFYDNGKFTWKKCNGGFEWDWCPTNQGFSQEVDRQEAYDDYTVTPYGEKK